jgi:hypothetical protein
MNITSLDDSVDPEEFDMDTFLVTRCAFYCVTSAKELVKLVQVTSQSKDTDAWWYDVYCEPASVPVTSVTYLI